MQVLKSCQKEKQCLGFNEGMGIMPTGNTDGLGFDEGMDMLPAGTNVWVSMTAWKSCQQETQLCGF